MSNFVDYYEYSKLANAAYVNLIDKNGQLMSDQLIADAMNEDKRLPTKLAEQTFTATATNPVVWTVSEGGFHGNDAEGFAATLFEKSDGSEKVLAIRGTEPTVNLYEDLFKADLGQIGFLGLAMSQAVSMINYMLRLQAGIEIDVPQLVLNFSALKPEGDSVSIANGLQYIYFTEAATEKGLNLIRPGEQITLVGHSLGGHLAALATRLFPLLVDECYTFNAPGFDPNSSNVAAALLALAKPALIPVLAATGGAALKLTDEFVDLVGDYFVKNHLSFPTSSSFNQDSIHNLESEDIAPGDDSTVVASILTGAQNLPKETFIPTERNSHMIEPFMDSLSLQSLLYRLKTDITTSEIENLFKSASTGDADVLEKLLTALRDLFSGKGGALDKIADAADGADFWIGAGDMDARRAYYDIFMDVEKAVLDAVEANPNLKLSLVNSSDPVAKASQNDAEGLAVRYALKELNPFAVIGADYGKHNQNGELDLYDPATGTGTLTEQYLKDRALMLSGVIAANLADSGDGKALTNTDHFIQHTVYFEDKAGGLTLTQYNPFSSMVKARYLFGDDNDDALWGTDAAADHLFGGAGDDTYICKLLIVNADSQKPLRGRGACFVGGCWASLSLPPSYALDDGRE